MSVLSERRALAQVVAEPSPTHTLIVRRSRKICKKHRPTRKATPGSQKWTLDMQADLVGIYRRCPPCLAIAKSTSKRALHPYRTHVATVFDGVLGKRPDFGEPHLPMQTYRGLVG